MRSLHVLTLRGSRLASLASAVLLSTLVGCGGDKATPEDTSTADADPTDTAVGAETTPPEDTAVDGTPPETTGDDTAPDPCAGVSCAAVPCKVNLRCDADNAPACIGDNAADGTQCDLLATNDGVCEAGACRLPPQACQQNAECTRPGTSCVAGYCAPLGAAGAVCEQSEDCEPGYQCAEGGICLGEAGTSCENDTECVGICEDGLCSYNSRFGGPCNNVDPSVGCAAGLVCNTNYVCAYPPGATCTDTSDCGPRATCDGTKRTCVVENGSGCNDNDQCSAVCLYNFCWTESSFNGPCDEDVDCLDDLACDPPRGGNPGVCRQPNGGLCFDNTSCLSDSTCVADEVAMDFICRSNAVVGEACGAGTPCVSSARCLDGFCAPRVALGGTCDITADCLAGVCSDSVCALEDGGACTANSDCVNTCVRGTCTTPCLTCSCDDADDCGEGLACDLDGGQSALTCKNELGSECLFTGPNSLCVNGWCTAKRCADPSEPGEPCLSGDDCVEGLVCGGDGTCGKPNGAACSANAECVNTCLGQVCGDFLALNGDCTADADDCGPDLACNGGRCLSADPGYCECRTAGGQCVGTINDECNPGFKPDRASPCTCPTACACIPE